MNQCYGTKEIENQPRLKNFNLKIILTCSKYNIQYMGQEQYSDWINLLRYRPGGREGGLQPYMGYTGVCRCEGYGFQAVYSRTGYINQSVWL